MSEAQEHLWFTRRDGQVRGPFPQRQITRYVLLGRIREDDELSADRETWNPLRELPQLIPEEMKNVVTDEDRQRLREARMRADERRGGDRRLGSERLRVDNGERRRASDRRQEEDSEMLRHREARRAVLDQARAPASPTCGPVCGRALAAALLLLIVFVLFTPERPASHPDCGAPPAPEVDWSNCRMPGMVAEQADLRGARVGNMDLTGANLVGSRLAGADLAYTTLNLADLRRTDLSNARLTGAGLQSADLRGARLAGADLSYADLRGARLEGTVLNGARLDHAIWLNGEQCQPGSVARCLVIGVAQASGERP